MHIKHEQDISVSCPEDWGGGVHVQEPVDKICHMTVLHPVAFLEDNLRLRSIKLHTFLRLLCLGSPHFTLQKAKILAYSDITYHINSIFWYMYYKYWRLEEKNAVTLLDKMHLMIVVNASILCINSKYL